MERVPEKEDNVRIDKLLAKMDGIPLTGVRSTKENIVVNRKIQNTGICPLTFRLRLIDAFQGNIPRTTEESPEKSSKSKTRRKIDVENERKTPRKPVFSDVLRRDEELAIFGGKLERSADRCFSFLNLDENMQLLVPERKKVEFGIRFQRPNVNGKSAIEKVTEGTTKRKKKKGKESSKKDEFVKSNYCHVAVLELTLGSSTFVQDLVIICSL
ncbi:uncharacterized protein LOC128886790 [Hylaeus anthracinus]|uniref:uncharacterized protein LOC128886790 n=1 Tax=Hylaeus anthracinus TaxID=313031 RepID=UPI0023B9A7DB|nr:uncharacterized protein LOC128886790 [Hylaeus anthracinus]